MVAEVDENVAPASSRLSAEVKQVRWLLPDDVDEVTEWTGASDVNEDEQDELPHLDDDAVVTAATAAAVATSAERKETERRGEDDDDDDEDAIPRTTPGRTALLLAIPIFRIFHTFRATNNNIRERVDRQSMGKRCQIPLSGETVSAASPGSTIFKTGKWRCCCCWLNVINGGRLPAIPADAHGSGAIS